MNRSASFSYLKNTPTVDFHEENPNLYVRRTFKVQGMMAHVSSFSYFLILSVLLSCEEKDTLKDKKRKQERAILSLAASGRPTVIFHNENEGVMMGVNYLKNILADFETAMILFFRRLFILPSTPRDLKSPVT